MAGPVGARVFTVYFGWNRSWVGPHGMAILQQAAARTSLEIDRRRKADHTLVSALASIEERLASLEQRIGELKALLIDRTHV